MTSVEFNCITVGFNRAVAVNARCQPASFFEVQSLLGCTDHVVNWMSTDVSEVRAASIIRAMREAARITETSVDIQLRTRQYIPEDSELHTRRRENLKSHKSVC
jgi:hypothetical protein